MSAPADTTHAAPRALRVLLVANDGFSAGHVARTVAVARALGRRAAQRELTVRLLLATTSEAHPLLAGEAMAVVHLPAPLAARRAGFTDAERRRLVRGTLDGVVTTFAPDLLVIDTFPSGPHGELAGVGTGGRARRALVRRAVPEERAGDATLREGLDDLDLAIVADDPHRLPLPAALPVPTVHVPPITMAEARDALGRDDARAALGLTRAGHVVLVASGGGGDAEAARRAESLAASVMRLAPETTVALALGPLAPGPARAAAAQAQAASSADAGGRLRILRTAPLQPLLAAFDGAFSPAGYNTAHELAKAGVPAALFAQPRPFDDQAARAARFAGASLAHALRGFDDAAVIAALAWMRAAPRPTLEAGGADRAADALLDLVSGKTGAGAATR